MNITVITNGCHGMRKYFSLIFLLAALLCGTVAAGLVNAATNSAVLTVSAVVSGSNNMNIELRNAGDDQVAAKMRFSKTSGVSKSDQYVRIDFDSNSLGARIILRTDNKNSSFPYTGSGEGAGLVCNSDTTRTVPLLWAVFPDLAGARGFQFTGDTDPSADGKGSLPGASPRAAGEAEGLVVDRANPGFESQGVLNYATVVLPVGNKGLLANFPTDEDGAGPKTGLRSAASPVYLVLGADFSNAVSQSYSTNTLGFDLVVQ